MEHIGDNNDLIDNLSGNLSIISSQLLEINILKIDNRLCVELHFALLYDSRKRKLILQFIDIKEYSFYYFNDSNFYYVERFKFFITEEYVYLSLDPVNESHVVSVDDNDIIKSISVSGFFAESGL